jgi:hypothetical protein
LKIFYIPLENYSKFTKSLKGTKFGFEEIPNFVLDILESTKESEIKVKWGLVPSKIQKCLLSFQKEGVE